MGPRPFWTLTEIAALLDRRSILSFMKLVGPRSPYSSWWAVVALSASPPILRRLPRSGAFTPTASVGPCPFNVGDAVTRGAGGAVVPPPGQSVWGVFDAEASSTPIGIVADLDGTVTIKSQIGHQPE